MLNKFKIWLNERTEKRLYLEELRAKENLKYLKDQAVYEYLASRPSISTIANAPRHEVKKAA